MMTGEQYKASLDDGRATFFEGGRVDDIPAHPILGKIVDVVAAGYDRWYSPEPNAISPIMTVPGSGDELR